MEIGDKVIVTDPDGFVADVRNKIKDGRVGEVVRLRDDDYALVSFPQVGRRKEFRHAFRLRFLEPAPLAPAPAAAAPSPSKPKI